MRFTACILLLLLGLAALRPIRGQNEIELEDEDDDVEELEQAFLLVRRHAKDPRPLEGKEVQILIELFNAGASAATNVRVKDAEWSEEDFSTSGSTEAYFENIPSGATVTHSYSVTPKEAGKHHLSPLTVTYQPIAGDSKEVVTETPWGQFVSFTFVDFMKFKAVELGSKATLGYVNTPEEWIRAFVITGGATLVYLGLKTYRSIKESATKRRRQKALEELQKMQ